MSDTRKIFTNADRVLLHGILKGTAEKTKGVKVSCWMRKVQAILATNKVEMTKESINQAIFWKANNQDVWNAVYELVEKERPGLFDEIQQGEGSLVESVA
ncbi:hypothetical protein [Spirosoma sp.]|uniref:hypothetical protein n=1 Tax=Spirosoma sp. TaxID=1899569 RepID=UPI002637E274|nr:hypothetical protein [Spirosoma sp.]MCX6218309.1 hypothetical protein [Spirosoma sp.]